jgi:hypothetical protein
MSSANFSKTKKYPNNIRKYFALPPSPHPFVSLRLQSFCFLGKPFFIVLISVIILSIIYLICCLIGIVLNIVLQYLKLYKLKKLNIVLQYLKLYKLKILNIILQYLKLYKLNILNIVISKFFALNTIYKILLCYLIA